MSDKAKIDFYAKKQDLEKELRELKEEIDQATDKKIQWESQIYSLHLKKAAILHRLRELHRNYTPQEFINPMPY